MKWLKTMRSQVENYKKNTRSFFSFVLALVDKVTWYLLFVGGGRWQVSREISRGAQKLTRTPHSSKKKIISNHITTPSFYGLQSLHN
ncbi:hypothetical protein R3W88_010214 [Solanum pinnatisectum]|uniref:Uncharacterized protein n=1 Tax=Solanum pinnatisectum TaxID=50273 RepID=A0AAV9MDJ0_9SOLN|nr:hypothetical protein R3W88_010214 [Solanum pinnatisectum]